MGKVYKFTMRKTLVAVCNVTADSAEMAFAQAKAEAEKGKVAWKTVKMTIETTKPKPPNSRRS